MNNHIKIVALEILLLSLFSSGFSQLCYDRPCNCVVFPRTIVIPRIERSTQLVDQKINGFYLAKEVYWALSQTKYKGVVVLRNTFEEVMRLTKFIKDSSINGFIKQFPPDLFRPDLYIVTSIDKEDGNVRLIAEAFDNNYVSRAFADETVSFKRFMNSNITDFEVKRLVSKLILNKARPIIDFVRPSDYIGQSHNSNFLIGTGVGYFAGNKLELQGISPELRSGRPNPGDLDRPGILSESPADNYIIKNNSVSFKVGQSILFDIIQFSYKGIISVSLRSTYMTESRQILGQNLFRKWYVTNDVNNPDASTSGTAYIYYAIITKNRNLFENKSFSIPVLLTYPVLRIGSNNIFIKLLGETNALLPNKIELLDIKGWDRYGGLHRDVVVDLGYIKEYDWAAGFEFECELNKSLKFSIQAAHVWTVFGGLDESIASLGEHNSIGNYIRANIKWAFN
jgi:hypothetical protein